MTDTPQGSWPAPVGPPAGLPTDVPMDTAPKPGPLGVVPAPIGAWSPVPTRTGPGRTGYWVGGLTIVLGSLAAIVWFAVLVVVEPNPDYATVAVPGDRQVELQAGGYSLFDEYPDGDQQTHHTPTVRITGPNGVEPITPSDEPNSYLTLAGRSGNEFATIHLSVTGVYRVEVTANPASISAPGTEQVTIGEPAPMGGYLVAMLLGAVTFFAGLAVIVTTAVRRYRWRSLAGRGR